MRQKAERQKEQGAEEREGRRKSVYKLKSLQVCALVFCSMPTWKLVGVHVQYEREKGKTTGVETEHEASA